MSKPKVSTILQKLKRATIRGDIAWEETEKDGVFQASFPEFSVRLFVKPSEDDPEDNDYFINIYNSNGTLIESESDVTIKPVLDSSFAMMKELYEIAKGYALGTEQTLDTIIETLPDPEDIPF